MRLDDFWLHVDARGPDDCWPWLGSKVRGRGTLWVREHKRNTTAPRVAAVWAGILTSLTDPLFACHTCHNPACVNPGHLYAGRVLDNNRDMVDAGRAHGQALTHCPHGHPYSGVNVTQRAGCRSRVCRECHRQMDAKWRRKNRGDRNAKQRAKRLLPGYVPPKDKRRGIARRALAEPTTNNPESETT